MRLLILALLPCVVLAWRFEDDDSSSNEERTRQRLVHDRRNFDVNAHRNSHVSQTAANLEGEKLVDYVNARQNLWIANHHNKFERYTNDEKRALMGVNNVRNSMNVRRNGHAKTRFADVELPESFDARERWGSACPSVTRIRDQSSCGSCWAFGAVEAMSDRICIASNGQKQPTLSARDLLSCCKSCGFGCNGGEPFEAWDFWHKTGIVTGSNFTANEGCQPYPFPPCEHHSTHHHFKPCPSELYHTPKCVKGCQTGYGKGYVEDKFYGKQPYAVEDDQEAIKKELYVNGPLEVSLEIYEDFLAYSSGVYIHQGGKLDGGHAVKLVGWGTEEGVPFWLVANSWNTDWGLGGFFKILRGSNECGIEGGVVGGIADLSRSHSIKQLSNYDIY